MLEISPKQVTPEIRSLFRKDEPQAPRCFNILDDVVNAGKIIVDQVEAPTWAAVQEPQDRSLYFGGKVDVEIIRSIVAKLRQEGDVLIGMWPDDPRLDLLPAEPYYDGRTLEFYDRPIGKGLRQYLDNLADGCELHRLDKKLIMQTEWGPGDVRAVGGVEIWAERFTGFCLIEEEKIVAEASAGPSAQGLYEPGVFTQETDRKKGYGTIVSAKLVQEIEARGDQTYWNCAKQNKASAAIAHKLGYRIEKEYRCIAWKKARSMI